MAAIEEKREGVSGPNSFITFVGQAAKALSEEFGTEITDIRVIQVNEAETEAGDAKEEPPKEGEPGYDGVPWQEANSQPIGRYAVIYSGEREDISFDPAVERTIMVGKWAFPLESYPPGSADGVPSIAIPQDI